ncbi:hypothetical protein Lal_00008482 [Lupinus albus]|nr:hypothetical protein Lal_00008482 [Lupinus albus]
MNFRKNLLTSHVKGKDIVLDTKTFSSLCNDIPMQGITTGFGLVCEWDNYDHKGFYLSLFRISKEEIEQQQGFGETVKNKDILSTGYLKLEEYKLGIDDNEAKWNVRGSQSLFPYAIFITKILEHFSVSLDGETKVTLNLRESKNGVEVFHKMGFSIDPIDCRTYRHHTNRPTAPTTQLEPTIPNQPEFQAPSSSSATMPSN